MNKFKATLKILGITWILTMILMIIFKIKVLVELFPVIGALFVIGLTIYTIMVFLQKPTNNIDKN